MFLFAGLAATALTVAWLVGLAARPGAVARWPAYGTGAVGALLACEALLALRVLWAATLFTALAWTAFIFIVDAAVYRRRGDSLLHQPAAALSLALLSIPAWLVFELYNLRLHNWVYTGVPAHYWMFAAGAGWAFATIWPAMLLAADLILSAGAGRLRCRPWHPGPLAGWLLVALGVACLVAPLLLPPRLGAYWFAPVWAGFVLLLDPLNHARGWPSLLGDLERGRPGRALALLGSGAACGFLWEFWNYWAFARWAYVFPIFQHGRVFAMPLPGFIGFPPFALECFTMAVTLSWLLLPAGLRWRGLDC